MRLWKSMVIPEPLHKGCRVGIVSTARSVNSDEIAPALHLLQSWGLEPVVHSSLFSVCGQWAGDDTTRAAMMQDMLDDDSIDAIWCARGGYGSVRVIDKIDFTPLVKHPRWIVGYSDVTVLHSHITRNLGIATLHATMPINVVAGNEAASSPALLTLRQALFERRTEHTFSPAPLGRPGAVTAPLVGGNLSILYSLRGTPYDIDTDGKILFIEDLDEYLYHIDRMMQNLKLGGKLSGLKALVVGAMSDMHDNATPFGQTAEEIIMDTVKDYSYPVVFGAPMGHTGLHNRAIMLGAHTSLEISQKTIKLSQIC